MINSLRDSTNCPIKGAGILGLQNVFKNANLIAVIKRDLFPWNYQSSFCNISLLRQIFFLRNIVAGI